MEFNAAHIVYILLGLIAGAGIGIFLVRKSDDSFRALERKIDELLSEAQDKARRMVQESKDKHRENLNNLDRETQHRQEQLRKLQEIIEHKNEGLKKRQERTDSLKMSLQEEETRMRKMKESISDIGEKIIQHLVDKSRLSTIDAQEELTRKATHDIELRSASFIQKSELEAQEQAVRLSKKILAEIMERYSAASSVEKKAGNILLPRDSKKGLIIGKNGKNITFFESLLDVDVIFNFDDPNEVIVSAFDLVQRHIAKMALESLIKERGVITHDTIKKHVSAATQKTDNIIETYGRQAIDALGLQKVMKRFGMNKIDPEFIKIIGRLQFRTSFGQNIMLHSLEVGAFSAMLAGEMHADVDIAYLGGFFHDVGKAIDQNIEESHDVLSKQILEQFKFPEEIVHAAWAHHDGEPQRTAEALIVKAADAISAGRPGARQDSLAKHIERIQGLEEIGYACEGVEKAYAISGGRELRMIVDEIQISDERIKELAHQAVEQIQERLTYPGKIKVNVIRRMVATAYAREKLGVLEKLGK